LYDKRRRSAERVKELREEKEEEVLKDCTFKPIINSYPKHNRIIIVPNDSSVYELNIIDIQENRVNFRADGI
jgi:hypothetical protein